MCELTCLSNITELIQLFLLYFDSWWGEDCCNAPAPKAGASSFFLNLSRATHFYKVMVQIASHILQWCSRAHVTQCWHKCPNMESFTQQNMYSWMLRETAFLAEIISPVQLTQPHAPFHLHGGESADIVSTPWDLGTGCGSSRACWSWHQFPPLKLCKGPAVT